MTELILIRHGETAWNLQSRWQGHLDSELTPLGLHQARAVADRLARMEFAALYSSDLGRARRTAEEIAQKTGHEPILNTGLRERGLGVFQGLTLAEIREQHPSEYEGFRSRDPDHVIPAGESLRGKHDRAILAIESIVAQYSDKRVVVVTHGGVLDSAFRHAMGLPLTAARKWILYNGSLNTFFIDDGNWNLATWGDVSHLAKAGTLDDY